ncbi:sugar transporter [Lacihabitans sp. LS3-19]|nr:sugar transporter [Lacihabitans sp. LS3-19]
MPTKQTFKISIFLLLISFAVKAQTVPDVDKLSDQQIELFIKQAESKGMSEMQIEAAAKANGYTSEDIIKVRERINRIKTNTTSTANQPNTTVREQIGEVSERAETQVDTKSSVEKKGNVFGREMFSNKQLNFEPNLRLPTPANYVLGPDDELSVDITGYAYQHYDLRISAEGTVKIESLAPIYLNGLSVQKAKEKILQRLKTIFAGLSNGGLNMDLTLGKVRSIKVTVVGEVQNPGTYSVSSLATLFNALYVSAGPNTIGSFRNIQLLRNNKIIQTFDLYDFLLEGSMHGNVGLQDQDVVFIPVADRKVEFIGQVKRPMIYELKSGDNLADAVKYAGGFTDNAYKATISIRRNTDKEREILSVNAEQIRTFGLQNGDKIEINNILDRYTNKVEVLGAVFRPGEYAIGKDMKTVGQLLSKAEGLREDAFRNRALLRREQENNDPIFIPLDLNQILKGEDFELKREDVLIIKSITELRELRKVSITGAINQSGEYDYADNMTVNDLIILSGGLQIGATIKHIEIARRLFNDESNDQQVDIITVEGNLELNIQATKYYLKPFDQVFIRELPNYQIQEKVKIEGEVNYPGEYAIKNRTERISDLINRAGGQRPDAYLKGAKFFRDGKQVAVNLEEVLKDQKAVINLFLENGDRIIIPKEEQVVRINGQVLNPTTVAFQPDFSFREYIAQAGGFSDSAFVRKTYVKYANGLTNRTRSFLGYKDFPRVEKGMQIIVPVKHRDRLSKAEIISISTAFVSLSAVLLTLVRLL